MPELPEVETVRRSLGPHLLGRRIERVTIARADVLRLAPARARRAALGEGARVAELVRRGKQLAMVLDTGAAVHVHLGMSGQLFVLAPGAEPSRPDHIHVRWRLEGGAAVLFRDPRRFGGVWAYPSVQALERDRWAALGPDALGITAPALAAGLAGSRRSIKACLLDQAVLAGVGNIYADEALFLGGIHPLCRADTLASRQFATLAAAVRRVLRDGVAARGSSLRDFMDAEQRRGEHQTRFRVYGRGGLPCRVCTTPLEVLTVAGRTTTICPVCQPGPGRGS